MPDGPHTTRFSWRSTHSRVASASWVGAGIELRAGSQAAKVLPAGKRARFCAVSVIERSRPSTSASSRTRSGSAGSQRWALAVAITLGCRLAQIGQTKSPGQFDHLVEVFGVHARSSEAGPGTVPG